MSKNKFNGYCDTSGSCQPKKSKKTNYNPKKVVVFGLTNKTERLFYGYERDARTSGGKYF